MTSTLIDLTYLLASGLMLAGIWQFMKPGRSRQGNLLGGAGLLLAVLATLTSRGMISIGAAVLGLAVGIALGAFLGLKANPENALGRIALLVVGLGFSSALTAGVVFHNVGAQRDADVAKQEEEWKGIPDDVRRANVKASSYAVLVPWNQSLAAAIAAGFGGIITAAGFVSFLKLTRSPLRKALPKLEEAAMPQMALIVVCILLTFLLMAWPGTETFLWLLLIAAMTLGYLLTIHLKIVDVPPVLAASVAVAGLSLAASGLVIGNILMVTCGALVASGGAVVGQSLSRSLNVSLLGLVRGLESSKTAASDDTEGETEAVPSPPASRTVTPDPDTPIL